MDTIPRPTMLLVPGDDWAEQIAITDESGNPIDLTGWTVTHLGVAWRGGEIALGADLTQASAGLVGFSANDSATTALPPGLQSTITLKMRSPTGIDETLYVADVKGVDVVAGNQASVALAGIQGASGRSFHAVDQASDLTSGFGQDGDTALVRTTGAEYSKDGGVWSATGGSFWGTLLIDGAAARDAAQSAQAGAETARDSAQQAYQDALALGYEDGWSPVLALVADGDRRVLQISDWTGGEGGKPAIGDYIGPSGLTPNVANATNIAGPRLAEETGPALGANLTTAGHWVSGDGADDGVFVNTDGRVGVGTSAPDGKLHLATHSAQAAQLITLQTTNTNQGNAAIRWQGQWGTNQAFIGSYFNVGDLGNLELGSQNTTRLIIRSNGDVGIGNYYPTTKLHVEGPIRLGTFTVGTVPDASTTGAGALIHVSDEAGGAVIAFCDGTDWRRMTDRAVIS